MTATKLRPAQSCRGTDTCGRLTSQHSSSVFCCRGGVWASTQSCRGNGTRSGWCRSTDRRDRGRARSHRSSLLFRGQQDSGQGGQQRRHRTCMQELQRPTAVVRSTPAGRTWWRSIGQSNKNPTRVVEATRRVAHASSVAAGILATFHGNPNTRDVLPPRGEAGACGPTTGTLWGGSRKTTKSNATQRAAVAKHAHAGQQRKAHMGNTPCILSEHDGQQATAAKAHACSARQAKSTEPSAPRLIAAEREGDEAEAPPSQHDEAKRKTRVQSPIANPCETRREAENPPLLRSRQGRATLLKGSP